MRKGLITLVGTYTSGESEGIYALELDPDSGAMRLLGLAAPADHPSFLAAHPSADVVYAVSELSTPDGDDGGILHVFSLDGKTGRLTLKERAPTLGAWPCHVSLDPAGRFAMVANYLSGSVTTFALHPDGSLAGRRDHRRHQGSGPVADRQDRPHPHAIQTDPFGRFALVPDLGADRLVVYRLDQELGKLLDHEPPYAQLHPGAGPRHIVFHPSGRFVYCINELDSTVTAFRYDAETGALAPIETVSTLPRDFSGGSTCAEIQIHPTGRFLYGSNRGHDSIAVYRIDEASGSLTLLGHEPTQGRTPRHFSLAPTGKILLAANQESNSIVSFHVDQQTGLLTPTGHQIQIPDPACVIVFPD